MVNNCVPLILTNRIGNKYPDIWSNIDKIYEKNSNNIKADYYTDFMQLIYRYKSIGNIIGQSSNGNNNIFALDREVLSLPAIMDATYKWRTHKQIYKFPSEMENLLYDNDTSFDIPIYILNSLPYDCIYIETNNLNYKDKSIMGFFFYKDYKSYTFVPVFEDLSYNNGGFMYDETNKDMTLKDGLNSMMDLQNAIIKDKDMIQICNPVDMESRNGRTYREELFENSEISIFPKMLQLVLYICSNNAEIEENPSQKKITRKPTDRKFIKDKYREVQIWDCGIKISEKIRTFLVPNKRNDVSSEYIKRVGKTKSPHSRRGHWHHFWTGKMNTDERKLTLKWVAPTFVNGVSNTLNVNVIKDE